MAEWTLGKYECYSAPSPRLSQPMWEKYFRSELKKNVRIAKKEITHPLQVIPLSLQEHKKEIA